MNALRQAYRHVRRRRVWLEAHMRVVVLAGASFALSRTVGLPPGRLRHELDTIWADVRSTHHARRTLAAMRSQGMLQTVDDLDIAARKRSSTVFVLGSGSSVNDLTDADWAVIGRHDSIGFNQWLIHGFVPTFYFVELGGSSLGGDKYAVDLLCRRLPDLGSMPIIVESKCWLRPDGVAYELPRQLRSRLYFYAPYYLRTTSAAVAAWVLHGWRASWRHGSCDLGAMVHHRASLSALVLFAFLAGYADIVLVGVDLNNSHYFWQTNSDVLAGAAGPPSSQSGQVVHSTVDPSQTVAETSIPIDDYLRLLNASVLRPNGVTLHVANPTSRLCSFLPVYGGLSPGAQGHAHIDADGVGP